MADVTARSAFLVPGRLEPADLDAPVFAMRESEAGVLLVGVLLVGVLAAPDLLFGILVAALGLRDLLKCDFFAATGAFVFVVIS